MLGSRRKGINRAWSQPVPDLGTQLENLFVHVHACEKWAVLDDRIDLATRLKGGRPREEASGPGPRGGVTGQAGREPRPAM